MKYSKDSLFEDTMELDLVYNNQPEKLDKPEVAELPFEVRYPVLPVKQFTKEEILALQDELDKRNVR